MIKVDEADPVGELDPSFPYREVSIRRGVDVKEYYNLGQEIGRGKFGTVYRCEEKKTGFVLAAKFVGIARRQDRKNVEREVEIMRTLQHPRLIQLYDAFEAQSVMCVVLELIEGGELFERVIDDDFILTEKSCTVFMRQICEGVEFIHSKHVIHLDLKPENILCLTKTGNRIKIIDFGLARRNEPDKKLQVLFGTPEFVAPEVVNFDQISYATDMWSVGVICYVLLSGLSPFMGETDVQTMSNVTIAQYDFDDEAFANISGDAKDFISKLLVKNKEDRLTASQCLAHPWLRRKAPPPPPPLVTTKDNLRHFVDRYIPTSPISETIDTVANEKLSAKLQELVDKSVAKNAENQGTRDNREKPNYRTVDDLLFNNSINDLKQINTEAAERPKGTTALPVITVENATNVTRPEKVDANNDLGTITSFEDKVGSDSTIPKTAPLDSKPADVGPAADAGVGKAKEAVEKVDERIVPATHEKQDSRMKSPSPAPNKVNKDGKTKEATPKDSTSPKPVENLAQVTRTRDTSPKTLDSSISAIVNKLSDTTSVSSKTQSTSYCAKPSPVKTNLFSTMSQGAELRPNKVLNQNPNPKIHGIVLGQSNVGENAGGNKNLSSYGSSSENFVTKTTTDKTVTQKSMQKVSKKESSTLSSTSSSYSTVKETITENVMSSQKQLKSTTPWFSELNNTDFLLPQDMRSIDRRASDISCFLHDEEDSDGVNLAEEIRKLSARLFQMSNAEESKQEDAHNNNRRDSLPTSSHTRDPISQFLAKHGVVPSRRPKFRFSNLNRDVPIGSPPPPSNIAYYITHALSPSPVSVKSDSNPPSPVPKFPEEATHLHRVFDKQESQESTSIDSLASYFKTSKETKKKISSFSSSK